MRGDSTRSHEFKRDKEWGDVAIKLFEINEHRDPGEPVFHSSAFSGNEANRLFLRRGDNFSDATLVSGADFREDGRGFVVFDFDSDGWLDLGIVSPNAPRFRILRNRISDPNKLKQNPNTDNQKLASLSSKGHCVRIRLVGGQTSAEASQEWSPRDPFGAKIIIWTEDTKRVFQLTCGEGLSIQNSNLMHIGLGSAEKIDQLEVVWPSGKVTKHENIDAGQQITINERPNDSGDRIQSN